MYNKIKKVVYNLNIAYINHDLQLTIFKYYGRRIHLQE